MTVHPSVKTATRTAELAARWTFLLGLGLGAFPIRAQAISSNSEIHAFQSYPAQGSLIYQGQEGSSGGHPLACQLQNGNIFVAFQA